MAIWSRVQTFIFGGAVATAAADGVRPVLEPVRQHAWSRNRQRALEPGTVARLVAQAIVDMAAADDEAGRNGFNENRLQALVHLAQVAPTIADARALRRRKKITADELHHVYAKEQIEPQFWGHLDVLLGVLLSPAEVANAIQQGHLPNPGVLPDISPAIQPITGQVRPPSPDGQPPSKVPLTQIDLDPLAQVEGAGLDFEQLQVLANLVGLPPGAETLLTMWNRELIDETSVDAGIREGHMKTKWAQAFKRMRWAVLSPQEAASARLRTWITADESYKIGKLTGHTKEQMDLMFLNRGRPASPTQMWTAWARKAIGPRGVPVEYEDHAKAIAISDIRPEYAEMLWQIRFVYPSLFQLNRLVTSHVIDPATGAEWAHKQRYAPEVVTALEKFWQETAPAKADPVVKSEQTRLRTATHKSYVAQESDDAAATAALAAGGVDPTVIGEVLTLWQHERDLIRAQLSPGDIRKAFQQGDVNVATGAAWTRDEAFTALLDRGWGANDANDYLNIPYKG